MWGEEEKLGSKGAGRRGGEKDGEWGKGDEVKGWEDGGRRRRNAGEKVKREKSKRKRNSSS